MSSMIQVTGHLFILCLMHDCTVASEQSALEHEGIQTPGIARCKADDANGDIHDNPEIRFPRRGLHGGFDDVPDDHGGVDAQVQTRRVDTRPRSRDVLPVQRQCRRRQAEQVGPEQGEDKVGHAKLDSLQQRIHGPAAEEVCETDPGARRLLQTLL